MPFIPLFVDNETVLVPSDVTNPVCTITGPTSAATFATNATPLTVSGTLTDNVNAFSVTWVNSLGGSGTAAIVGAGTTSATWSASIPLVSGDNVLTATGRDAAGNTHADVLTVTYTPVAVLPITETWDVSNAAGTMSGVHPWVQHVGTLGWGVVSNALQLANSGGTNAGRLNRDLLTSDIIVTATVEEFFITAGDICVVGPCARMQGDNSFTFYAAALIAITGSTTLSIQRFMGGVQQQIGASFGPVTPSPGMTIGLWTEGTRLRALFNGVVRVDATDAGIPTGRYLGLEGWTDSGNRVRVASIAAVAVVPDLTLTTVRAQTTLRPPVTLRPVATVHAPAD